MRLWHLLALALAVILAPGALAADDELLELREKPAGTDEEYDKFLQKKKELKKKHRDEMAREEEELRKVQKSLAEQRATINELKIEKVTVDENEIEVNQPRTMEDVLNSVADKPNPNRRVRDEYEISTDDFDIYVQARWSINPTDFRIDEPQYVTADLRQGSPKRWFVLPFSVSNPTSKKLRICPTFTAHTNQGVINYSVSAFTPERIVADSLLRPKGDSAELRDKELLDQRIAPLESQARLANFAVNPDSFVAAQTSVQDSATFEPGQTRWGVAVWPKFSDEFTELKIVVAGVTNAHKYDEKMRRVLVLTFQRIDDEYNVNRTELKYRGKQWSYLWNWDQCIEVPIPDDAKTPQIRVQELTTASGGKRLMWSFPWKMVNSTYSNQQIALNKISFVVNTTVTVAGVQVPVEVCIDDDGKSSIYKAEIIKALPGKQLLKNADKGTAKEYAWKDRFQFKDVPEGSHTLIQRRTAVIETKGLLEQEAIFDETDVNWENVREQVEAELSRALDKKAAAGQTWERIAKTYFPDDKDLLQKNPGLLYDPRRRLTDEELAEVKEQVRKAIPAELEKAKQKKTVVAYFDCAAGLASGSYRISRCYKKPGVVAEEWLTEWEQWVKQHEENSEKAP